MGDLAGNDVGWRIAHRTRGTKVAEIADALCEAGRFGQKTGKPASTTTSRAAARRCPIPRSRR